ncbi:MAG: GGDEF domain-containing protein [Clostridiales bacterium]|nr:GGDEF domain-containing protein [Clostridiales bacterium]
MESIDPEKMTPEEIMHIDSLVLNTIREFSSDTVYFKDLESRFLWNSKEHALQVGVSSPDEMFGKTDFDFFPESFAQAARNAELKIISTGKPILNQTEEWKKGDGEDGLMYFLASKYPLYNEDGQIIGTWGISKNITAQKRMEKELERSNQKMQRLARIDELTGLYNRIYFYELMEQMIGIYGRRDDGNTFSIVAIDVDDMKPINDQYGQPKGDDVLRHVASSIRMYSRKTDTVFRIGGDEFVLMLPDCDKMQALGIAKTIMKAVSDTPIDVGEGKNVNVTISMGVASYEKGNDISELISMADRKLYKSKRNGKNQASF